MVNAGNHRERDRLGDKRRRDNEACEQVTSDVAEPLVAIAMQRKHWILVELPTARTKRGLSCKKRHAVELSGGLAAGRATRSLTGSNRDDALNTYPAPRSGSMRNAPSGLAKVDYAEPLDGHEFQHVITASSSFETVLEAIRAVLREADIWIIYEIDPQMLLKGGGYIIAHEADPLLSAALHGSPVGC
ncbi:hypothetical protein NKH54_23440 [Mesorhizobium sp. M1004]|uniref:hypothetical protein n=1 Tax=Mesorhizobium sp. M1004 TaxID=2957046 RepID=UPI00333568F3